MKELQPGDRVTTPGGNEGTILNPPWEMPLHHLVAVDNGKTIWTLLLQQFTNHRQLGASPNCDDVLTGGSPSATCLQCRLKLGDNPILQFTGVNGFEVPLDHVGRQVDPLTIAFRLNQPDRPPDNAPNRH